MQCHRALYVQSLTKLEGPPRTESCFLALLARKVLLHRAWLHLSEEVCQRAGQHLLCGQSPLAAAARGEVHASGGSTGTRKHSCACQSTGSMAPRWGHCLPLEIHRSQNAQQCLSDRGDGATPVHRTYGAAQGALCAFRGFTGPEMHSRACQSAGMGPLLLWRPPLASAAGHAALKGLEGMLMRPRGVAAE